MSERPSNGAGVPSPPPSGQARQRVEVPKAGTASGDSHASAADFNQVRNDDVLSMARRVSGISKREIAEVVSWASDGAFQFSDIGRLTAADLPKL